MILGSCSLGVGHAALDFQFMTSNAKVGGGVCSNKRVVSRLLVELGVPTGRSYVILVDTPMATLHRERVGLFYTYR